MSWLSPVFPTGGFAYSSGLETAVQNGLVNKQDDMKEWLASLLTTGSLRNDLILFAQSWREAKADRSCAELALLAIALCPSQERYLEQTAQGAAFISAVEHWPIKTKPDFEGQLPLPVIVGGYCGAGHIELEAALISYMQAFITNQLQAAIRLSVLGQNGTAQILAQLETVILEQAAFCAQSDLSDLGSSSLNADIASMKHETQTVRLFRT